MSLQKSPTSIGKLEFLDIKKSLTEYLSSQSIFSGYAFQGSAMSTLIDLMAYNAYYYALYSNMIVNESFLDSAQRIQSLISLTKPLGYTIPSKTSSKAQVALAAVPEGTNTIPKYTMFYGKNAQGIQYKFYNLSPIPVIDSQTEYFTIHEAKNVIEIEAVNLLDVARQRIAITDIDMDIETLEVLILNPINGVYEIWNRVDNTGYSNTIEQKIYFVERTETGFLIEFGLYNSVGKDVTEDISSIKIRYLKSSGVFGNNIFSFTCALGTVFTQDSVPSSGGREEPNLDEIRFLAPKWFAAQERAVTVNDYKALVLEAGFFGNASEFNIYGGEEITPSRYGRVFVTSQKQLSDVNDLMNFIKQRSILTVLPEYVTSVPINVFVDFSFTYADGLSRSASAKQESINNIIALFNSKYAASRTFNLKFDAQAFCNDVTNQFPEILISPTNFLIYVEQTVDAKNTDYYFNLQNPLRLSDILVLSQPFTSTLSPLEVVYYVRDESVTTEENLKLYTKDLLTEVSRSVGRVNPETGTISIKSKVMSSPVTFKIPFKRTDILIGLNNLTSFSIKNVSVL